MAHSLNFELGQTKTAFNRFAIPNTSEDRVSLPVDDTVTSYRLMGLFDLENGNQIYFLVAPLASKYNFRAEKNFEFDREIFTQGIDTEVDYKFNSYRLGYLWNWNFKLLRVWAGFVGKIRDAKIKVSQASTSKSFDNVGFVPLASFGFEYNMRNYLSFYSHTDALTSRQGSAYDSQLEIRFNMKQTAFSIGKRILGGGADNDNVYSFAQFDTYYAGINYKF